MPVVSGNYYHQCYFDQTIDGAVAAVTDCDNFNDFTYDFLFNGNGEAAFGWSALDITGVYELYMQVDSVWGTTNPYIPLLIKEDYSAGSTLALDLDARFAVRSTFAPQSGAGPWSNISRVGTNTAYNLVGTFATGWGGTGVDITDPYALTFDGISGLNASRISFGTTWSSQTDLTYSLWLRPEATAGDRVILSNQGSNEGYSLLYTSEGKLKLSLADDTGIPAYSTEILADGPIGYWPLNQVSGTTVVNLGTSGSNLDATYDAGSPNSSTDSRLNGSRSQRVTTDSERLRVGGAFRYDGLHCGWCDCGSLGQVRCGCMG